MDTIFARIFTKPFLVTIIRYALVAAGTWLVTNGYLDEATWQTILGATLTIIIALLGGVEAGRDKAVVDGKSVPVSKLPASAQADIKTAVDQPRKRRSFFDMFVGK